MTVEQTNIRELIDITKVSHNARLERYRTDTAYAKRMIVALQNDLASLKSAEMLVLQRMNRTQKLVDIEKFYVSDRFQTIDPLQTIRPVDSGSIPAPDPRINWSRNQLLRGNENLQAERDRIGSEIIKVALELQRQRQKLLKVQKDLKSIGGTDLSPQMEKDNIAKRLYTEVYMLYEVHKIYRAMTYDANGNRRYNADSVTLDKIQKLSMMFQAYSERNPYVLSGDLTLDYDDPGADLNKQKIELLLDRVRQVYTIPESQTLDPQLKKYSDLMYANLNDSFVSKEILREIDSKRKPAPDNALNEVLAAPAKAVNWALDKITLGGLKILMSWDATSLADAATTGFYKFISGVNNGLPFCTEKPLDPETKERLDQNAKQDAAEQQGGQIVVSAFAQTQKIVPPTEMDATIKNYNDNITEAINDDTGKGTAGRYTLTINALIITAYVLYQVRILTISNRYLNYLIDLNVSGNISSTRFLELTAALITTLRAVVPPFQLSGTIPATQIETNPFG